MKISANDIKIGNIIEYKDGLWSVIKNPEHTKPGKGPAYIQLELKNLETNNKLNIRLSSSEMVVKAFIESKKMQFLYFESEYMVFMDNVTFEQMNIEKRFLGEKYVLLSDGMIVDIEFYQNKVISIVLPMNIGVTIEYTEPVIKGATVTSSYKKAMLSNGLTVMVPPYLSSSEEIIIKTEDLSFVSRAKIK